MVEVEPDHGEVTGCPVGDGPALVRQEADPEPAHQVKQVDRLGPGGRSGARSAVLPLLLLPPWPTPFGTHIVSKSE